ncbi:hypothetical protein NIES2119_19980 [[Phormidium ambiguum] IAM M-71]|uniref:Guanylate cyclase domain-containing protein n=1 Tax=[Phormidium ambiguum] IAM M-71 TaxID=454136 RepID=A0A1U7IF50_9CYAN|nr:adenylate/guanylate cyclase domain-containing protein [Phormidium ambiguum]OKH35537.1 hypothetical protein NIES2119_19980 [Phormidium ambiguum IAM M-71]
MNEMVTMVFTDLVNSTALKNHLPGSDITARNEIYRDTILFPHRERVENTLANYGGRKVETIGDAFFLVFPNPIQALLWAIAIQKNHAEVAIPTPLGSLQLTIGMHTGCPLPDGNNFIGQEVDYAARVAALASGGQILLSEATATFVRDAHIDEILLHYHGDRYLKGIGEAAIFEALYEDKQPQPLKQNDLKAFLTLLTPLNLELLLIKKAYQACSPPDWPYPIPDTLEEILTQLNTMPPGKSKYTKTEQFLAYLVADSTLSQSVSQNLKIWGEQNIQDFPQLLNEVQQTLGIKSSSDEPYLMVVIRRSEQNSISNSNQANRYFVDAWLITDDRTQSRSTGEQLSKPESFREALLFDEIPELLKIFLAQSAKYSSSKLTIEIFLPLDLINQSVDSWEIDDELGLPVTLGSQYKIVVRSYERILPTYLYKGFWQEKWKIAQQLTDMEVGKALICGDSNNLKKLFVDLNQPDIIGLKLTTAPVQTGKGSVFALILKTAIPVALWLRQNLANNCDEKIDGLLQCCIDQLPENVKMKRLDAILEPPDTHIGHHLSLLWENPDRLPPNIDYSM